jgi:hypothetical protein
LISLGTGEELPLQLVEIGNLPRTGLLRTYLFNKFAARQSFLIEVAKYCKNSLTSCKTVHDDVLQNQDRDDIRGRYFRFNTPGMGNIGLEEWSRIPDMSALTLAYMESQDVRDLKLRAAGLLLTLKPKENRSIADFGSTPLFHGGRAIGNTSGGASGSVTAENTILGTVDN